ncbi:MAG: hypothetical protein R6V04_12920 [bacterium]
MDQQLIKEKLKNFFQEYSDYTPADNENLFEKNILDSYGIVEFLSYIDENLDIEIQIEDITEENFSTIEKICTIIQKS